jgi:hypothetical protein
MTAPTGYAVVLNSRKSNFMDEEITIFFITKDTEYPFLVTNGCHSFDCISWNEACDKFDHFYAYCNQPIERIDYAA